MSVNYFLWNSLQRNNALASQVEQNTVDITTLQGEIGTIPDLTLQVEQNTDDIMTLSSSVSTLTENVATLTTGLNDANVSLTALGDEVDGNTQDISTLQGEVSALQSSPCGQWYKTSNQTINTIGAPSTVPITWSSSSNWTDTSIISHNSPNGSNFTVNTTGIYRLDLQVLYNNINTATFTDRSILLRIMLTRGIHTSPISQTNFDIDNNNPTNVGISTGLMFELQEDDVISFVTLQYISAGSFNLVAKSSSPPDDFDLNTFWTWQLVRTL